MITIKEAKEEKEKLEKLLKEYESKHNETILKIRELNRIIYK